MISGASRDVAARVGSALGALGIAAVLIVLGPRLADFPSDLGGVGPWFSQTPEQAFVSCLGLIAWICLLWLCTGVVLGALAALPGAAGRIFAALARRVLPGAIRRIVEVGLGVTLVAASVSPLMSASPAAAATGTAQTSTAAPAATTQTGSASEMGWPYLGHPDSAATGDRQAPPTTPPRSGPAQSGQASPNPGGTTQSPDAAALRAAVGDVLPDDLLVVPLTPIRADAPSPGPKPTAPSAAPVPGGSDASLPASQQGWPYLGLPDHSPVTQSGPTSQRPTSQPSAPSQSSTPAPDKPSVPRKPSTTDNATPPAATGRPAAEDPVVPAAPLGTGRPSSVPGAPTQTPLADPNRPAEVVVLRGDSLWSIVARHLGPSATTDQIAAEWPRWWSTNADVIGPDPDVILPGQRLVPPPAR